jgi:hypothetical protein
MTGGEQKIWRYDYCRALSELAPDQNHGVARNSINLQNRQFSPRRASPRAAVCAGRRGKVCAVVELQVDNREEVVQDGLTPIEAEILCAAKMADLPRVVPSEQLTLDAFSDSREGGMRRLRIFGQRDKLKADRSKGA